MRGSPEPSDTDLSDSAQELQEKMSDADSRGGVH